MRSFGRLKSWAVWCVLVVGVLHVVGELPAHLRDRAVAARRVAAPAATEVLTSSGERAEALGYVDESGADEKLPSSGGTSSDRPADESTPRSPGVAGVTANLGQDLAPVEAVPVESSDRSAGSNGLIVEPARGLEVGQARAGTAVGGAPRIQPTANVAEAAVNGSGARTRSTPAVGSERPQINREASWAEIRRELVARGVAEYRLETRGGVGKVKFSCSVPSEKNRFVSRRFEAVGDDDLTVVREVLRQIAEWQAESER